MARFQVGEVYAASFRLAFGNFATFLRTQGVVALALAVVSLGFSIFLYQGSMARMIDLVSQPATPDPAEIAAAIVPILVGALALLVISLLVAPITYGIGLRVADAVTAGPSSITLAEAWRDVKGRYGALLGLFLLFVAIVVGLTVAFVVAAIVASSAVAPSSTVMATLLALLLGIAFVVGLFWLVLRWFPSPAVVFFEGASPAASLRRAAQLTEGSRGAILGLMILLILTFGVPAGIVGSLFTPTGDPTLPPEQAIAAAQPTLGQQIGSWVVQTAFSLVGGFVGACAMVLVYRQLSQPTPTEPSMGPIAYAPPPVPPGL